MSERETKAKGGWYLEHLTCRTVLMSEPKKTERQALRVLDDFNLCAGCHRDLFDEDVAVRQLGTPFVKTIEQYNKEAAQR